MKSELSFFRNRHVWSWWSKTLSQFVRVIGLHGHTNPWELHPNPSFVVIICRGLLFQLEFLFNSFCVEIFKIWQILVFWLSIRIFIFYVGSYLMCQSIVIAIALVIRLHILPLAFIQSKSLLLSFQCYFLQERFNLLVVIFPEVVFVAFYFNIQLLNSYLLLFFFLLALFPYFSFRYLSGWLHFDFGHFLNVFTFLYFFIHFF